MSRILDDAVDAMSAREVEELKLKLERRLQRCVIDGADGAHAVRATYRTHPGGSQIALTLMICPACLSKHRLPEGRAVVEP